MYWFNVLIQLLLLHLEIQLTSYIIFILFTYFMIRFIFSYKL